MVEISLTPLQIYFGLTITAFFSGLGQAFGQYVFSYLKERAGKLKSKGIKEKKGGCV